MASPARWPLKPHLGPESPIFQLLASVTSQKSWWLSGWSEFPSISTCHLWTMARCSRERSMGTARLGDHDNSSHHYCPTLSLYLSLLVSRALHTLQMSRQHQYDHRARPKCQEIFSSSLSASWVKLFRLRLISPCNWLIGSIQARRDPSRSACSSNTDQSRWGQACKFFLLQVARISLHLYISNRWRHETQYVSSASFSKRWARRGSWNLLLVYS